MSHESQTPRWQRGEATKTTTDDRLHRTTESPVGQVHIGEFSAETYRQWLRDYPDSPQAASWRAALAELESQGVVQLQPADPNPTPPPNGNEHIGAEASPEAETDAPTKAPVSEHTDGQETLPLDLAQDLTECRHLLDSWVVGLRDEWEPDLLESSLVLLRRGFTGLPGNGQAAILDYAQTQLEGTRHQAEAGAKLAGVLGMELVLKARQGEIDALTALDEHESGDAKFLAYLYAGRILFDHAENTWYTWAGHHWKEDKVKSVPSLVTNHVAGEYLEEAARQRMAGNTEKSNDLVKRAGALRFRNRVKNVLGFASEQPALAIEGNDWDRDPWLLPCVNGVVDLRTGEYRPGRPGDFIREVCLTNWEGLEAPAPRWEQFLDEIFGNDAELVAFVKRLLGYGLTGLSVEHILPIAWGANGWNGKDTLFTTLGKVLGPDLAGPVPAAVLLDRSETAEGPTPGLYSLRFKRMVWASETKEGARLNAARVKMVTGGGAFQARKLHSDPVTVDPKYLPWLMTNYKPHAPADDDALWDRILLVPFNQRFVNEPEGPNEHPRDSFLPQKLAAEAPGILASLVLGCLAWQSNGLRPPEMVKLATAEYRDDEDDMGRWLAECCIIRAGLEARATALYESYVQWCGNQGIKPMSQQAFGRRLTKRGFTKRLSAGYIYEGLGLAVVTIA